MAFTDVDLTWNGRIAKSLVPPQTKGRDFELAVPTVRSTERALAAVQRSSDLLPGEWEPFARLLLRAEGVASSAFEAVRAPIEAVMAAEISPDIGVQPAWIADNLATMSQAVALARTEPLTIEILHDWHRQLMAHAIPTELLGALRDRTEWIGGTSPLDAAYVAPPHELVPDLMADLVEFANRADLDPITHAAILHAQFESIHPYSDGNGRLGRVLVSWLLVRRVRVAVPPPFSIHIGRDPGGYLSGLTFYRLGEIDRWVSWFSSAIERSARTTTGLVDEIEVVLKRWRERVRNHIQASGGRMPTGGSTLWAALDLLPEQPIVSARFLARRFHITDEAARLLIKRMSSFEILSPLEFRTGLSGRPTSWWAAREIIGAIASWS